MTSRPHSMERKTRPKSSVPPGILGALPEQTQGGVRAAGNLRRHLSPGRFARRGLNLATSREAGACCYGQPGILRKCGIGRRQPAQQERSPAIGFDAPGVSAFRAQLHTRPILRRPARVVLFRVRFVSGPHPARISLRRDLRGTRAPAPLRSSLTLSKPCCYGSNRMLRKWRRYLLLLLVVLALGYFLYRFRDSITLEGFRWSMVGFLDPRGPHLAAAAFASGHLRLLRTSSVAMDALLPLARQDRFLERLQRDARWDSPAMFFSAGRQSRFAPCLLRGRARSRCQECSACTFWSACSIWRRPPRLPSWHCYRLNAGEWPGQETICC